MPPALGTPAPASPGPDALVRPRLVVLGSGFAGYSLLGHLPQDLFRVTVISPANHFLFTPLLASAAVGTVELRSILEPVRRRRPWVELLEAEAVGIDFAARRVSCRAAVSGEEFSVDYDRLVVAVGAAIGDYGIPGVAEHALFLKTAGDARAIRHRVLVQLASAEVPGLSGEEIARRLTFVVCGGGATGVEVAAEIDDFLDGEMRRLHPELAPHARVVLVEALERLLGGFDEALATYTRDHFARTGIEVRTGEPVAAVEAGAVRLASGTTIPAGAVIWAGGNAPRLLVAQAGLELERGRIVVDDHLRVPGHDGVWALGDCAVARAAPMPATAQVAQQQGKYLGRAFRRQRAGRPVAPFSGKSMGMLAYIGGGVALADLPQVKWSGRGAWLFWRSVYLTRLVSLANKVKVLFDWGKAAVFGRDASRF
jgi:NADH:ubiquinone reductase (non-electrogenic)